MRRNLSGLGLIAVLSLIWTLGGFSSVRAQEAVAEDATPPAPEVIIGAAFANRYEVDLIAEIDLIMRDRFGNERRRRFHTVSKIIDDRVHSIGRLIWPEHVRGMTVMVIEAAGERYDAFVFLPSIGRVRRITTSQRGDAFLGSDLTYEDFERRRVDEYDFAFQGAESLEGEPAYVIRGRPHKKFSYDHVDFVVAQGDAAILETRYFKRDADDPYRVIATPRKSMKGGDGHVLPTRFLVQNLARGTTTEVVLHGLQINPTIDDRIFSVATLDQERRLPESDD